MQFSTTSSPHLGSSGSVSKVMLQVLIALIPGTIAMWWYFGWGILINIALASCTAVIAEYLFLKIRKRDAMAAIGDLSAILTAWLLALALPPILPWWQTVIGSTFAIVIAKQLFGGLGYNPFNPAMIAYVFLLISYPASMTSWLAPESLAVHSLSFTESINAIFSQEAPLAYSWDAITSATPLDEMRTNLGNNMMVEEIRSSPLWGDFGGIGWEWVSNWFLLGGLFLLWRKVINWRIPASMLGGLLLMSGMFWLIDPNLYPNPAFHLFSGATMLGAFFIATDPVSASTTPRGQIIYGAAIGFFIFVIRAWGGYPDAVAFAVLLLNMAAPMIDYYTQPAVFGALGSNKDSNDT